MRRMAAMARLAFNRASALICAKKKVVGLKDSETL